MADVVYRQARGKEGEEKEKVIKNRR